jgi:hypothetical protein
MNVAIVGGGNRCRMLLEFIEKHSFREISVQIIAVADEREDAPGAVLAREKGLFVTSDYNDFFGRDDIALIIELTGNQETYFDILAKKDKTVRAIDKNTAILFWEFILSSRIEQDSKQELEEIESCYDVTLYIYDAIINEYWPTLLRNYAQTKPAMFRRRTSLSTSRSPRDWSTISGIPCSFGQGQQKALILNFLLPSHGRW